MSERETARGCILVVDDDVDIRTIIRLVLELHGYRVMDAGDGKEALLRLRQGQLPCLILLDLMMPGMNGWQFRHAQENDLALAQIPVVVLSGGARVAENASSL